VAFFKRKVSDHYFFCKTLKCSTGFPKKPDRLFTIMLRVLSMQEGIFKNNI